MKGEPNMRTLVKNGRIVTAVDAYHADILIVDGTIAAIGRDLGASDADVIDTAGRMVIPGGVDPHTHLENPSGMTVTSDDFLTGSRAAAGGTTTIIDFARQNQGEPLHYAPPAASPRAAPAVQAARPQPPVLSVRCGASRRPAGGIQRWPAAGAGRAGRPQARHQRAGWQQGGM